MHEIAEENRQAARSTEKRYAEVWACIEEYVIEVFDINTGRWLASGHDRTGGSDILQSMENAAKNAGLVPAVKVIVANRESIRKAYDCGCNQSGTIRDCMHFNRRLK